MSQLHDQISEAVAVGEAEDQWLRLLDADPRRASQSYLRIFQKLVRLFAAQSCSDPESLASETIMRVYRAFSGGLKLTSQFETFLFGVAKNVALEDGKRRRKAEAPLDELSPGQEPFIDPPEETFDLPKWQQEIYHECCQRCLQELGEPQRAQLLQFYQGRGEGEMKRQRKQLADRLGTNTRALSSRMLRLREKLEHCIKACVKARTAKPIKESAINS